MRTAKTLIRLGRRPSWSESSLGAHSFCWFCHVAAHLALAKCLWEFFLRLFKAMVIKFEPPHDKTNKRTMRPVKTQISLGIRPVWSESSLCTQWVATDPSFLHGDRKDWSDIRLGGCPGWSKSLLGAHAILLVLSWGGSFHIIWYLNADLLDNTCRENILNKYKYAKTSELRNTLTSESQLKNSCVFNNS